MAVGEWFYPPSCAGALYVGLDGPALMVQQSTTIFFGVSAWDSGAPIGVQQALSWKDLGLVSSQAIVNDVMARGTTTDVYLDTSGGPSTLHIWHGSSNSITLSTVAAESPRTTGLDAIALGTTLDIVHTDGSFAVLRQSQRIINEFALDRSNGNQIVWAESDDGGSAGYINTTLWTSPYATMASALSPKKVSSLKDTTGNGGGNMVVNAGAVLTIVDASTVRITRLSDGWAWDVSGEPGDRFVRPLWVDDAELWALVNPATSKTGDNWPSGVVRISRSTLGNPTVPPGI
jgi:hypothetical protein